MACFLAKLFPDCSFPSVQSIVENAVRDFNKCETVDESERFLQEKKESCIFPGPFCQRFSITRASLLNGTLHEHGGFSDCPVGLVTEICNFAKLQKINDSTLHKWLQDLVKDLPPTNQLKRKLGRLKEDVARLRKNRSKPGGESALQEFLHLPFGSTESRVVSMRNKHGAAQQQSPVVTASKDNSSDSCTSTTCQHELLAMSKEMTLLKASLKEKDRELLLKHAEMSGLRDVLNEKTDEVKNLKIELDQQQKLLNANQRSLQAVRQQEESLRKTLKEKRTECIQLRKCNLYARCMRLKRKLDEKNEEVKRLQSVEQNLEEEKSKKRKYQVYASQMNKKRKKTEDDLFAAQEIIQALTDENNAAQFVPETRNAKGHFTEPVVMCVMELMGECEVPARRCSPVIQTVARRLFQTDLPDNMLPSKTSNLRFADQTHAVAKMHVAEELATKKFDLHADGTSRSTKKYVGFQVTLQDKKTLALGFDPVSQETAQTLLDISLSKLEEFSLLHSPEDSQNQLKIMLGNIVGVMTDRAVKMKCFGKQLEERRKAASEEPEAHVKLEFLNCNAHFLLGLSTAADKALKKVAAEMDLNGRLGRECIPAFQFYKSQDSSPCRYIRMACDTLGPRGDEQCGCHQLWIMFCNNLLERPNAITSFRGNRFNNLFSAAAGLIHHREDIIQFFQRRPPSNLKQKSVEADARCDALNTMVLGLAVMFVYFTGPFWNLVNSNIHYLDQFQFIQPMHSYLKELVQHPDLFMTDVPYDLEVVRLQNSPVVDSVLHALASVEGSQKPLLLAVFKAVAEHFVQVVERQLADFLLDGKYGLPPSEEARQRMQHCQLTNLLGEACFADLDYSMFKSRGATLHHHSTTNMAKRNKPVSCWLSLKSAEDRSRLMEQSRKLGPQMRDADRQRKLLVLSELQEAMEMEEEENRRKEQRKLQMKQKIADEITAQGGPCRSQHDVEGLLERFDSKTEKVNAIKMQIRYLKVLMQVTDPRLQLSNLSLEDLSRNLSSYLEEQLCCDDNQLAEHDLDHMMLDHPGETQEDGEEDVGEFTDPPFKFTSQGQTVAVYYDDGFFIGQVLQVNSDNKAEISFMLQKNSSNVFRWPESDRIETVDSMYVFFSDFDLTPKNRIWSVKEEDWATLTLKWKQYVHTFC